MSNTSEVKTIDTSLSDEITRYIKLQEWASNQLKEILRKDNKDIKESIINDPSKTIEL